MKDWKFPASVGFFSLVTSGARGLPPSPHCFWVDLRKNRPETIVVLARHRIFLPKFSPNTSENSTSQTIPPHKKWRLFQFHSWGRNCTEKEWGFGANLQEKIVCAPTNWSNFPWFFPWTNSGHLPEMGSAPDKMTSRKSSIGDLLEH